MFFANSGVYYKGPLIALFCLFYLLYYFSSVAVTFLYCGIIERGWNEKSRLVTI